VEAGRLRAHAPLQECQGVPGPAIGPARRPGCGQNDLARLPAADGAHHGVDAPFQARRGRAEDGPGRLKGRLVGGDVAGKVVFTKDVVYLRGLLGVHAFFLKAIQSGRPELIHHLFAGRMALGDALELDPFFRSGALIPPRYEPGWVKNRATLAAFLIFSLLSTSLRVTGIELPDFGE
jgi:hypothetical protein